MRYVVLAFLGWVAASSSVAAQPIKVTFSNAGVTLAGEILLPDGQGPFPAVAIVHGSGGSDRSNPWTAAYASALKERGVAVLHPDKRGSGESDGTWREATFSDLAGDALAAVDVLREHPEVDYERVGLIGFSQGGHIVPKAAVRSDAVAFVVSVSSSVVPIMEQIGDELRMMGEREGLTEEELSRVSSIHERGVHYALARNGWSSYEEALEKSSGLAETDVVRGFPTEPDAPAWDFLRTIGDYDPLPHWRRVDVPVLFLYGGRDENVDVYKSVDVIRDSLAGLDYSLLLFRENGHALFREDAMDFIARWIRE